MNRSRGRPRLPATEANLLAAAYAELEERGYRRFSMEGVARRAGASKATIYRRWRSTGDLLLEALARQTARSIPLVNTGNLKADLKALLVSSFKRLNTRTANLIRSLMAEAQVDEAFKSKFRETFIMSRRAGVRSLLEAAINRGELPTTIDREFIIDVVYGVVWYRLLISHAPLDERCATQLVDLVSKSSNG
jgi:AcrR family transcriptional regulator